MKEKLMLKLKNQKNIMENRLQNWKIGKKFNRNESGEIKKMKYMKKIGCKTPKNSCLEKMVIFCRKIIV